MDPKYSQGRNSSQEITRYKLNTINNKNDE